MKKALSCLGLALALVSIPQFVSANDTAKKVAQEVVEDQNTTKVIKKATDKAEKAVEETAKKVAPTAEEASKN